MTYFDECVDEIRRNIQALAFLAPKEQKEDAIRVAQKCFPLLDYIKNNRE